MQESEEYTCTNGCIKKYYTHLETPKIESEGGVDISEVKAKQVGNILELTLTIIEKMKVEIWKLNIRMMGKKCNSTKSQFPSIVELFESKSNVEECNLFPKDYNEYNATKRLI